MDNDPKDEYQIDDTYTIDSSQLFFNSQNGPSFSIPSYGAVGSGGIIGTGGAAGPSGSLGYFNGPSGTGMYGASINYSPSTSALKVSGKAEFDDDIIWKGKSLATLLSTIEKRLAILQPNPEKLEKFEALRKAYEHYKTLEAMCDLDSTDQK